MNTGIVSVGAITIICYLVAQSIKATPLANKWLPCICGCVGGVLGYVGLLIIPNFPADDILTSIAVGIVSGLAATGSHEAIKQIGEKNDYKRT